MPNERVRKTTSNIKKKSTVSKKIKKIKKKSEILQDEMYKIKSLAVKIPRSGYGNYLGADSSEHQIIMDFILENENNIYKIISKEVNRNDFTEYLHMISRGSRRQQKDNALTIRRYLWRAYYKLEKD